MNTEATTWRRERSTRSMMSPQNASNQDDVSTFYVNLLPAVVQLSTKRRGPAHKSFIVKEQVVSYITNQKTDLLP